MGEDRSLRIAHRGAPLIAAENTIPSLAAAVELGADLVEFDIVAHSDGTLIVAHSIREQTPESPTLERVLRFFAEEATTTGLHVDLKSGGVEAVLVEMLRAHGLLERTFVSSCHAASLRALRSLAPDVTLALTYPYDRYRLGTRSALAPATRAALACARAALPPRASRLLRRAGADALSLHHSLVSRRVVEAAHHRDAAVIAWTVDDVGTLRTLLAAGVDGIVTNDLSIFGATLRR